MFVPSVVKLDPVDFTLNLYCKLLYDLPLQWYFWCFYSDRFYWFWGIWISLCHESFST